MGSIFIKSLDSKELESRFSTDDKLQYYAASQYSLSDVSPYLQSLPAKEADLIMMYYVLKKDQKEIAKILKLSQGGVSHRIARARERLKYLVSIPKFSRSELMDDLKEVVTEEIDLVILWELYRTTCQSKVAEIVGMTQSRVRHRFFKTLKLLRTVVEGNPESRVKTYVDAFTQVSENFNISREVCLPRWQDKNSDYKDIREPKTDKKPKPKAKK